MPNLLSLLIINVSFTFLLNIINVITFSHEVFYIFCLNFFSRTLTRTFPTSQIKKLSQKKKDYEISADERQNNHYIAIDHIADEKNITKHVILPCNHHAKNNTRATSKISILPLKLVIGKVKPKSMYICLVKFLLQPYIKVQQE